MIKTNRNVNPGTRTCPECKKKSPKYHRLFVTAPPGFGTIKNCPGFQHRWEQIVYNDEEIHKLRVGMY